MKKVWRFHFGNWWLGVEVGFWHPVPSISTFYFEASWGKQEEQCIQLAGAR